MIEENCCDDLSNDNWVIIISPVCSLLFCYLHQPDIIDGFVSAGLHFVLANPLGPGGCIEEDVDGTDPKVDYKANYCSS